MTNPVPGERSTLLRSQRQTVLLSSGVVWFKRVKTRTVLAVATVIAIWIARSPQQRPSSPSFSINRTATTRKQNLKALPLLGEDLKSHTLSKITWPNPIPRCEYVVDVMNNFARSSDNDKENAFITQATDANTFYRATARLFWRDFGSNSYENQTTHWTESDFQTYWIQDLQIQGTNVSFKSLWTWTTGDQHLSNFGAWRNRHGDVVFGVNDFDESAIYDFQIDVLRVAVSIANHARTNGFSTKTTHSMVELFANAYVKAVIRYVGNENAALFELTPKTAKGKLQKFLMDVDKGKGKSMQQRLLEKFTQITDQGRRFIKGDEMDQPHNETNLAPTDKATEHNIRAAISPTRYGATRMKLGWNVHEWSDDFFQVLDVAERIGSGIGSFGVDRYYVLLKGTDNLLEKDSDGGAVILDVKYQPPGAVHDVLSVEDEAWYANLFANDAARVVAAQSRLTSFTDPFLGWFLLPAIKEGGGERPFSVRQRSPWKRSFDISKLDHKHDFAKYIEQIALATATAHVRGTVAKAPADFKNVVASVLGKKSIRKQWTRFLTGLAMSYREQVLLDYGCFRDYVMKQFGNASIGNY